MEIQVIWICLSTVALWHLYPLCLDRVCFLVPKPNLGLVLVPFHVSGVHGWVARPFSAHSQAVWIQCAPSVPLGFTSAKNVCLHVIPWRAEVFKSDVFFGVLGVSQTQVSETLKTREKNGSQFAKDGPKLAL